MLFWQVVLHSNPLVWYSYCSCKRMRVIGRIWVGTGQLAAPSNTKICRCCLKINYKTILDIVMRNMCIQWRTLSRFQCQLQPPRWLSHLKLKHVLTKTNSQDWEYVKSAKLNDIFLEFLRKVCRHQSQHYPL